MTYKVQTSENILIIECSTYKAFLVSGASCPSTYPSLTVISKKLKFTAALKVAQGGTLYDLYRSLNKMSGWSVFASCEDEADLFNFPDNGLSRLEYFERAIYPKIKRITQQLLNDEEQSHAKK